MCGLWSSWAPLLSEAYDGSAEPSLLCPIPIDALNSMRGKSTLPAYVGLTNTLVVPRIPGAVFGILLKECRPVGWIELLSLSSRMTCWFHTRVPHPFPVASVVSARCPGVVCWTVMVPSHPRMHVPLVFWAPARCGTHVTDDLFGCPLSAASVFSSPCLRGIPMCLVGWAAAS